jgi:hypothetical protein
VLPAMVALSATLNPSAAGFSLTWSQVSGAGIANFAQPANLATEVSFSEPGTYVLAIQAVGNGSFVGDQVVVTVNDTYEAWAARNGAGLPEEDDDNDRLYNLLEYALDLDPGVPDPHPLTVIPIGADLLFTYTRYLRKIDITYEAQTSVDLGAWNPATETVLPSADVDTEPRSASIPATAKRAFWRLFVEKL